MNHIPFQGSHLPSCESLRLIDFDKEFMFIPPTSIVPMLTTNQFARALALKPQSLRKRLSQTGSYFGVRPYKLPNGKLRWPSDGAETLLKGASK